jgi:hypothetical protein
VAVVAQLIGGQFGQRVSGLSDGELGGHRRLFLTASGGVIWLPTVAGQDYRCEVRQRARQDWVISRAA